MTPRIEYVDGELDEIVTNGGAHLERMDADEWFLECVRADGADGCGLDKRHRSERRGTGSKEGKGMSDIASRLLEMADSPDFEETPGGKLMFEGSREITRLRAEVDRLREALRPFANPPHYVLGSSDDTLFVPRLQPDGWIGGGQFSTLDFVRARKALEGGE